MSNFIQTPSVNERIVPGLRHHFKGDSTPKHVGGEWRMLCTIRDATTIARQSVCGRLKKHASMAASWLSLARQDEAIDNLLASWDSTRKEIK